MNSNELFQSPNLVSQLLRSRKGRQKMSRLALAHLARRLRIEQLEDRRLMAVLTVNATDDSDDLGSCGSLDTHCTLREAVRRANTDGVASEIRFSIPNIPQGSWATILLNPLNGPLTL